MNTYFVLSVCIIAAVVYSLQIAWYLRRVKALKSDLDRLFARHVALLAEKEIMKASRAAEKLKAIGLEGAIAQPDSISFKAEPDEHVIKMRSFHDSILNEKND
jgi:hypothetical protein